MSQPVKRRGVMTLKTVGRAFWIGLALSLALHVLFLAKGRFEMPRWKEPPPIVARLESEAFKAVPPPQAPPREAAVAEPAAPPRPQPAPPAPAPAAPVAQAEPTPEAAVPASPARPEPVLPPPSAMLHSLTVRN